MRCFISATKALRSASSVCLPSGDSEPMLRPSAVTTRGKRLLSVFTQCGVYAGPLFFQVPNHSSTSRTSCSRACASKVSMKEKSNLPSSASICSQAIGTCTVLGPMSAIAGHTCSSAAG
ncbi:hypothetical protein D3C81_1544640 [compost metagenome]